MEYETYQYKIGREIIVMPRDEIQTEIIEAWPIYIKALEKSLVKLTV